MFDLTAENYLAFRRPAMRQCPVAAFNAKNGANAREGLGIRDEGLSVPQSRFVVRRSGYIPSLRMLQAPPRSYAWVPKNPPISDTSL